MPIHLEFDNTEGLPDALKAVLVERDGKFILDGETPDEVKGLKAAVDRERTAAKKASDDLKRQVEAYKDIDPDKAREAFRQLEELEEKGLRDAGKVDELFEKRMTTARESWDREKAQLIQARDKAVEERTILENKYQQETIDSALREAMATLVKPEHYADVANRLKPSWRFDDQGELLPMRQGREGWEIIWGKDPTKPISMVEQIEALLKDVPVFSIPSAGGGAGNGSYRGGLNGAIVLSREQAKDARLYREARDRAEKLGVELEIAPA